VSAPGTSPPGVYRVGGPYALLTGAALFAFEKDRGRFRLESVHPGHTVEDINASTGFAFASAPEVRATPGPDKEALALLRGRVLDELSETYPQFAGLLHADAVGKAA
jgi:glutaconate CoA-transferase subunit B